MRIVALLVTRVAAAFFVELVVFLEAAAFGAIFFSATCVTSLTFRALEGLSAFERILVAPSRR